MSIKFVFFFVKFTLKYNIINIIRKYFLDVLNISDLNKFEIYIYFWNILMIYFDFIAYHKYDNKYNIGRNSWN